MSALVGVVENSTGTDVEPDVRSAVEKVLACFDKDPTWRTIAPASEWEKWARELLKLDSQ